MEFRDIGIFYFKEDGEEWAEFLQTMLAQSELSSNIEDIEDEHKNPYSVNLVLATPAVFTTKMPDKVRDMNSDYSLMVLLGAEEIDFKLELAQQRLKTLFSWMFVEMCQTEESVSNLIGKIEKVLKSAQYNVTEPNYDTPKTPMPVAGSSDNAPAEHPPTVEVAISETDKDIEVFLLTTRKGSETITIHCGDNVSLDADVIDKAVYRLEAPDSIFEEEQTFEAYDEDSGLYLCDIIPTVPDNWVVSNSEPSKEDIIRDIFGDDRDPIPLACQLFLLDTNKECETKNDMFDQHLDNNYQQMKAYRSPHWDVKLSEDSTIDNEPQIEEFPTLLHFSAEYGLLRLTSNLLEHPNSFYACHKMNIHKEAPQMIAHRNGYTKVEQAIKSFMKREKLLGKSPYKNDDGFSEDKNFEDSGHHDGTKKKTSKWKKLIPGIKKKHHKSEPLQKGRSQSLVSASTIEEMYRPKKNSKSKHERESGYYESPKDEDEPVGELSHDSSSKHLKHSRSVYVRSPYKTMANFQ